jgi:hypothetical protein
VDAGFGGCFGVVFFEDAVLGHGIIFGAFFLLWRYWRFEDHDCGSVRWLSDPGRRVGSAVRVLCCVGYGKDTRYTYLPAVHGSTHVDY